jgi:hypothetical protein
MASHAARRILLAMTSRLTPKQCSLRESVGERELCPGGACVFWEAGGAVLESGCAIERLGVPVVRRTDLARHLLDLRLHVEAVQTDAERRDAHRRFAELLNLNRE